MDMKIIELEKTIKDFRENMLRDFIVGGSFALVMVGGFNLPVSDIDIEIEESNVDGIRSLRVLETASPKITSNYDSDTRIDFMFKGIQFNAFIVPESTRTFVWKDFVKYSTVMAVINHKRSHGRVKDFKAINSMVIGLLSDTSYKTSI